jgi:hypothetical protein
MRHRITVLTFLAALYTLLFINLIKEPDGFSRSERRRLAQFPELTIETVRDGSFMDGFDDYTADQAAFREPFRRVKAFFDLRVLRKLDNNGIFVRDGYVFKTDYPLNERSVLRLCGIINTVYSLCLDESNNVWFAFVPDKNAHLRNWGHLVLDYRRMESIIRENLRDEIKHINLFDDLSPDSYYRTDSHWRQEKLFPVADTMAEEMGFSLDHKPFTKESFDRFYGVYYGQSALNIEPDTLVWLVSETTRRVIVNNIERPGLRLPVYDLSQLEAADPYSLFMCGPSAIVTAKNPDNTSRKRLIMFRDSFASALSPLLLDAYSEITLIDLRYISPRMLGQLVDFSDSDVLFIYSAGLFNTGDSVRGASQQEP